MVAWEGTCHIDMSENNIILFEISRVIGTAVSHDGYNKELLHELGSALPSECHFRLASLVSCRLELYQRHTLVI